MLFGCISNEEKLAYDNTQAVSINELEELQEEIEESNLVIPEEYKSFFSTCQGIPSWTEKIVEGRAAVVGYCEIDGKKFTQFTIDDPKSMTQTDDSNTAQQEEEESDFFKLTTVPLGTLGHPFYLSSRNFPSVGQSFALESGIELTSIGVHVNQRVTLLTPEGVELFRRDPTGMSLSKEKAGQVEKALFNPGYKFPATVEVFLYRHNPGPIPSNFDIRSANFELVFNEKQDTTIRVETIYQTTITTKLTLNAGYYLAVWRITNPPEDVLSIFLSGRPEGLDGSENAYVYGRTYSANSEAEFLFNEHPTKSGEVDSKGEDIWCRGDLQIFIVGTKIEKNKIDLEAISDLPKGLPPDIQSCWSVKKRP